MYARHPRRIEPHSQWPTAICQTQWSSTAFQQRGTPEQQQQQRSYKLSGTTPNVAQNNRVNGGFGNLPINGGQLMPGSTLQNLMFGTMSVFVDELTEGHELSSGLVGKAQGFYVVSSEDDTSQTAVSESHLAIMVGTGKYVNAKDFAMVKTFPASNQQTDGAETLLQFTFYLTY